MEKKCKKEDGISIEKFGKKNVKDETRKRNLLSNCKVLIARFVLKILLRERVSVTSCYFLQLESGTGGG